MKKVYVRLNRTVGNTEKRIDETHPYGVIFPFWSGKVFLAPPLTSDIKINILIGDYVRVLEGGNVILYNSNGGWNTLHKSDIILAMSEDINEVYQK